MALPKSVGEDAVQVLVEKIKEKSKKSYVDTTFLKIEDAPVIEIATDDEISGIINKIGTLL